MRRWHDAATRAERVTRAESERTHEIRSALLAIEGASAVLSRHVEDLGVAQDAELASALHRETARLQQLLAANRGPEGATYRPLEVLEPLVIARRASGQRIALDVPAQLRATGRPHALAEAMTNLLSNAAAHAPGSAVRIAAVPTPGTRASSWRSPTTGPASAPTSSPTPSSGAGAARAARHLGRASATPRLRTWSSRRVAAWPSVPRVLLPRGPGHDRPAVRAAGSPTGGSRPPSRDPRPRPRDRGPHAARPDPRCGAGGTRGGRGRGTCHRPGQPARGRVRRRLAVLDLQLAHGQDGSLRVAPLRAAGAQVVVLSGTRDLDAIGRALDAGAIEVLDKTQSFDQVLAAIGAALAGACPADPARLAELQLAVRRWRSERDQAAAVLGRLTPREREVLDQLADGRTVDEVAEASRVSPTTVRSQVASVLSKLGVHRSSRRSRERGGCAGS